VFDASAHAGARGITAQCAGAGAGIALPMGFFRWNRGVKPRRSSKARFLAER
jgi:hypothetical protein